MYKVTGDGIVIYSDVSPTESRKAVEPRLTLSDNAAGSLEITLPSGNAGYDKLERRKSEIIVYRDNVEIWSGRIISEKVDFWKSRVFTCEGELAYLNDTIQPQHKYEAGTTVRDFLTAVIAEHNKRFTDERYRFYIGESRIYNADEELPEIVTDYETTLDCINKNIIEAFQCHVRIEKIDGKKYIGFVKDESLFSENTQVIRFGENLLDFTKNWDLTDLATVLIPRGAMLDTEADEDSDAFDKYVTLSDIPKDNVKYQSGEWGHYQRDPDGSLSHDENGDLIYIYDDVYENGKLKYKYEKDSNGYIPLETEGGKVTIRVNTKAGSGDIRVVEFLDYSENQNGIITAKIRTDGSYAEIAFRDEDGDFPYLKDVYGHAERVVDFSDAEDSVELIKNLYEYLKEERFDKMTLEVSAVDLRYLTDTAEPLKILDRMRCISYPHGMNTLFTVTELNIELDRPESAKYTLQKTLNYTPKQSTSLSGAVGAVSAELESPQSTVLLRAKSDADKILREKTNGYVTLVTDTEGGRHSESLVISSGRDYRRSEHFWVWNVNGLGHYTEYADGTPPTPDKDDLLQEWSDNKEYKLNVGITMDGQIVANRITVGHMSADRVRTGMIISQDGNVVWNLNREDDEHESDTGEYIDENGNIKTITCPRGSLVIKKGSIDLGSGAFSVDTRGNLHAEKGNIGGFTITASNIYNSRMSLDGAGLHLRDEIEVGYIGTSAWVNEKDKKLIAMNLEHEASGFIWGYVEDLSNVDKDGNPIYTAQMVFTIDAYEQYKEQTLYVHGNLDLNKFWLYNAYIDPDTVGVNYGLSGNVLLLLNGAIKSDGTINTSQVAQVTLKNGFIVSS